MSVTHGLNIWITASPEAKWWVNHSLQNVKQRENGSIFMTCPEASKGCFRCENHRRNNLPERHGVGAGRAIDQWVCWVCTLIIGSAMTNEKLSCLTPRGCLIFLASLGRGDGDGGGENEREWRWPTGPEKRDLKTDAVGILGKCWNFRCWWPYRGNTKTNSPCAQHESNPWIGLEETKLCSSVTGISILYFSAVLRMQLVKLTRETTSVAVCNGYERAYSTWRKKSMIQHNKLCDHFISGILCYPVIHLDLGAIAFSKQITLSSLFNITHSVGSCRFQCMVIIRR